MEQPKPEISESDMLFLQLVTSIQGSSWVSLGKIANPMTNQIEKNLEMAKVNIDMLICLKEKTKGNLSSDLDQMLSNMITQLETNYVEVAKEESEKKPEEKSEEKPTEAEERVESKENTSEKQ